MRTEPRSMRSSKITKGASKNREESNEDEKGAGEPAEDEEEEMDYGEVLVASGTSYPKPPHLGEEFKINSRRRT